MKKKNGKKMILMTLVLIVLTGAAGWFLYQIFYKVEVVPVSALKDDWWKDYNMCQGIVTNHTSQEVLPVMGKTLDDIYVEVGQTVKAGDPLLSFDMEKERIDMELKASELREAKRGLNLEEEEQDEDLELRIRELEVEYETLKKQVEDATIHATIDGIVKEVNLTGAKDNVPLVVVAGEDQLYVEGFIDEFSYVDVEVGSVIKAVSGKTGQSFQATITEISTYPATAEEYKPAEGQNPNMSYYPFSAVITDEIVDLSTDETVNVVFDGISERLYLPLAYVRSEGSESYIYVRNDRGRLEKRVITTGQSLYNAVVEIKDGLTTSDYVAFPYGKGIWEGANTKVTDDTSGLAY